MRITYEECECHPLSRFLNVRWYTFTDYDREIMAPAFGPFTILLARPNKGTKEEGFCFKAFGSMWFVVLSRGPA